MSIQRQYSGGAELPRRGPTAGRAENAVKRGEGEGVAEALASCEGSSFERQLFASCLRPRAPSSRHHSTRTPATMPQVTELSRRSTIALGGVLLLLSLSTGTLIHFHPEELNAPAWVAYSAAASFFIAGLLLLARVARVGRVRHWLAPALLLAMET